MRLLKLRALLRGEPGPGRGVLRLSLRPRQFVSELGDADGEAIGFSVYGVLRRSQLGGFPVAKRLGVEQLRARLAAEDVDVGARALQRLRRGSERPERLGGCV